MRLVWVDEALVVDAERVVALWEYTSTTDGEITGRHTRVYLDGKSQSEYFTVDAPLVEVVALLQPEEPAHGPA